METSEKPKIESKKAVIPCHPAKQYRVESQTAMKNSDETYSD